MEVFIYIMTGLVLLAIIYQDLTYRKIHIALPVVLMLLLIVGTYRNGNLNINSMLEILMFLILNMIGIFVYFSFKNKKIVNPFAKYIGLGDILFLIAILPLFILRTYMLFFITGMLFSLLLYLIFKNRLKFNSIPLAGYLSLYLATLMILNTFLETNIFRTLYF